MTTATFPASTPSATPRHRVPAQTSASPDAFRRFASMTPEAASRQLLFHGSSAIIDDNLRGGPYDGVMWTAEVPNVAQNYISVASVRTWVQGPSTWEKNERVVPHKAFELPLLRQMKRLPASFSVVHDTMGRAQSWNHANGDRMPTQADLFHFIEQDLGYRENDRGLFELKLEYREGPDGMQQHILPANYRKPGNLYIMEGRERLRILDVAEHTEGDLQNPQYHAVGLFRHAAAKGYDAVRIHDFAQSKNWGNVDHTSIGLFPSGLAKVMMTSTPARHFDWPEDGLTTTMTPEYLAWHASLSSGST